MTVQEYLKSSTAMLTKAGISTARLDCLVLLEDATSKDRSWLLAHPEYDVKGPSFHILKEQIERRSKHEPLAYIRRKSEFYGREFRVSKDTLQPRPETETMIDMLKTVVESRKSKVESSYTIVDVGTGSGCLAITAKLEFPEAEVVATDISSACIKIAEQNAKKLGADIKFYQGDLLQPLLSTFDFRLSTIMANLPYVPDGHTINQAAMQEPEIAIFGGEDGLDLYRRLFAQISKLKDKPRFVLTESLPFQHIKLVEIAEQYSYRLKLSEDFIQCFKSSATQPPQSH